jgi:hypothetical protein
MHSRLAIQSALTAVCRLSKVPRIALRTSPFRRSANSTAATGNPKSATIRIQPQQPQTSSNRVPRNFHLLVKPPEAKPSTGMKLLAREFYGDNSTWLKRRAMGHGTKQVILEDEWRGLDPNQSGGRGGSVPSKAGGSCFSLKS